MRALFRRQAVEHATSRLSGQVILASPAWLKAMVVSIVAVALAGAVFVLTASYSRKETVTGWVVPEHGLIRVSARQTGTVQSLDVSEGRIVQEHQQLALLKVSLDNINGDVGAARLEGMAAEQSANQAAERASRQKLRAQGQALLRRRTVVRQALADAEQRASAIEARQVILDRQVKRAEALRKGGYLADAAVDQVRTQSLEVAKDMGEARAAVASFRDQAAQIDVEIQSQAIEEQIIDAKAAGDAASLAQREAEARAENLNRVVAPVGGRVVAVPVERGQAVASGTTLIVLVPANSNLIAELYVPSRAAGFIAEGQAVKLMYNAFPFRTFGVGNGVIRSVSRTVLSPSEVAIPGVNFNEPVFRVRVELKRPFVQAYGKIFSLQPGMLLDADIVLERRTFVQWLFEPIFAAGRRL